MRILILGGDGMLGHQLLHELSDRHEIKVTLRQMLACYAESQRFSAANAYDNTDVQHFERIKAIAADFKPEAVVNAVGIVKQRDDASLAIPSIEVNALFPHRLHALCRESGTRLVHMSTDCVFSGRLGNYRETDTPDAQDIYGRSKLLGEIGEAPGITLRTSIIGRELTRKTGLLEWFLAQKAPIKGFRKAIFSGFTTIEMSRIIEHVLLQPQPHYGVFHVSSAPINKHDLLVRIRDRLGLPTEIVPDDAFVCDRSLNSERFQRIFNYTPPSWSTMIEALARDLY